MNEEFFDRKSDDQKFWIEYFKINGTIKTANIVGFTSDKKIKKYNSAVEILK